MLCKTAIVADQAEAVTGSHHQRNQRGSSPENLLVIAMAAGLAAFGCYLEHVPERLAQGEQYAGQELEALEHTQGPASRALSRRVETDTANHRQDYRQAIADDAFKCHVDHRKHTSPKEDQWYEWRPKNVRLCVAAVAMPSLRTSRQWPTEPMACSSVRSAYLPQATNGRVVASGQEQSCCCGANAVSSELH